MTPFTVVEGTAAPMPFDSIDTDQIIPARFLRRPRKEGYQDFLFHDERFLADGGENPEFVLNRSPYRNAQILVAGKNFACGSSREGAVYALADYGIRSVIAPSFSDIFFNNALINGLLPVRLTEDEVTGILGWMASTPVEPRIVVDLVQQSVSAGGKSYAFRIDGLKRRCMLEGLDEISLTRTYAAQIESFEQRHLTAMPWLRRPQEGRAGT
jgi:3-isopropylmalate/(R)-2-methylmalate dehydratase small subunit